MSGLKMKFGGDSGNNQSTHNTDFSYLENNPNYKPEDENNETIGQEITGDELSENDIQVQEPTEDKTSGDELKNSEPNNTSEGNDSLDKQSIENEPTETSSLNDTEPPQQDAVKITDELLLKNLSEKLGKEVKSFDDLTSPSVEIDPQVKALNEWKEKTGRPIEDFFKFQKDFSEVSDLEIAREFLQLEYPTLTDGEISLELEKFQKTDDDLDTDAVKKNIELKKYAAKGRELLEKLKGDLGEPVTSALPPEIQQQVEFAKQVKNQIENNKGQQESYFQGITDAASKTESMSLNLTDDLSIDFKISEEDRKSIPSFINEMSHWRTEDDNWNHQAVVQDSIRIKHFDKMIKLAYEQGINSGKDELIKQTKNTTLGQNNSPSGQQNQGKKKPIYENLNLDNKMVSLKFGK